MPDRLSYSGAMASLPKEWPFDVIPEIRNILSRSNISLVVLDDDPTGTQTVYDVPVLMDWSVESLHDEFAKGTALFYVLTNSRRYTEREAVRMAREIGQHLVKASTSAGCKFRVISRSDSTLRGHYPAEVEALMEALGLENAVQVIMPFFFEGGRITIGDVHYVLEGDDLIPVENTSFAADATFGYHSSNLKEWVQEKTLGVVNTAAIESITIDDIRKGGPQRVAEVMGGTKCKVCIINAASRRDAEVVALGLLEAEKQGVPFICRTAASIVPPLAGLYPRDLLGTNDIEFSGGNGSLTIVGSYQSKATAQLNDLLEHTDAVPVYLDVMKILFDPDMRAENRALAKSIDKLLKADRSVVLFTTREVMEGNDPESSLQIIGRVSACLVEIVSRISVRPRFVMTKGGITSSDIATEALKVKRAQVLGQILPGVPVWRLDPKSRFGALPYIVFPGNVGEVSGMTDVLTRSPFIGA